MEWMGLVLARLIYQRIGGNKINNHNMSKHIELAKKLKALSDKGIGGEKVNAEKMLNELMKKHNLTIEDIEGEKTEDYYFNIKKEHHSLFVQIVGNVKYKLPIYGEFPDNLIKDYKLKGNYMVTCTVSEFIEIETMFDHYSSLYENELEIFFGAFLSANNLLITPPKDEQRSIDDLSPEELKKWKREQIMAAGIKSETFRKRLNQS